MLGREVSMPLDLMMGKLPENNGLDVGQSVTFLQQSLEKSDTYVIEFTRASRLRQKRYYDRTSACRKLKPNDRVWVYFPTVKPGTSPKLTSFTRGPFSVTKVLSDVTYEIFPIGGSRKQIVHIDRMKRVVQEAAIFTTPTRDQTTMKKWKRK